MHTDPLAEISEDPLARIGLIMLAAIALMALFAPLLSDYSPHDYTDKIFSPPDLDHPLGTDSVGQDIWVRLLYGARTSLIVAGAVAILSSSLSVIIGATAALAGGYYERFCMRLVDAITSLPTIVVMILVAAYLRPSLALLVKRRRRTPMQASGHARRRRWFS